MTRTQLDRLRGAVAAVRSAATQTMHARELHATPTDVAADLAALQRLLAAAERLACAVTRRAAT